MVYELQQTLLQVVRLTIHNLSIVLLGVHIVPFTYENWWFLASIYFDIEVQDTHIVMPFIIEFSITM